VLRALQKILTAASIEDYEGKAFYSDGEEILIENYEGTQRRYFCGREYERPVSKAFDPYLLVVIDAQEASIGTTDGERIKVLWTDTSLVPGKHRHGGMSQARFQRGHEEAVKQWLRKVLDITQSHFEGQRIIVGGAGMTKDRFLNEMPS